MARKRVCNVAGCPAITTQARCHTHTRQADRDRGTAAQRGYDHQHRTRFREQVLAQQPICAAKLPGCTITATVADHYPTSRRELEAQGQNPNDPKHGRGLCHSCHSKETAKHQKGGWHSTNPPK